MQKHRQLKGVGWSDKGFLGKAGRGRALSAGPQVRLSSLSLYTAENDARV